MENTYGKIVAKRFRRQYYDGRSKKWETFASWEIQPERVYIILLELKSKKAICCLLYACWTNRLPKRLERRSRKIKKEK